MAKIVLGRKEFRDKVYACWMGKNIGGTIGTPVEGRKHPHDFTFYDPVPTKALANDDLDLQLAWLKMMEDRGLPPKLPHFAEYWMKYLMAYPWSEYGFCGRNLDRGLRPPVSGCFENYYVDEMGSPIRSEIWACIAPADPQRAAALAWMDSAMDHAGGEGMYGEMFMAAVESAAFVVDDPRELIRIGLSMIPISCAMSRCIREAVWCCENGKSWGETRERVLDSFGHVHAMDAPQNHGFEVLGLLKGRDFGERLCKAVNCGYDTDCTGATVGALLGIMGGSAGIPKEWIAPIGEEIVLHKFTGNCDPPKTISELTDRTVALAEAFAAQCSDTVAFGERTKLPKDALGVLSRNELAQAALAQDVHSAVELDGDVEIILHYNGDPVIRPGIARTLGVSLRKDGAPVDATVSLRLPAGWKASARPAAGPNRFEVSAARVAARNEIGVEASVGRKKYAASFTILGPEEAKGFAAQTQVPKCKVCWGREGHCVCGKPAS